MAVRTSFTAGEVLTAADLTDTFGAKGNLASPTFTGTPAAPTASAGTNTTQLATTAFVQAAGGLVHINTTSFSAVSSVSVSSCFSSTFDNYAVQCFLVGSTNLDLTCRLRLNTTDNSASSYQYAQGLTQTSPTGTVATAATSFLPISNMGTATSPLEMIFYRPFLAANTAFLSRGWRSVDNYHSSTAGQHNVASSFNGFSLIASTGNITGTIRIYGYNNS